MNKLVPALLLVLAPFAVVRADFAAGMAAYQSGDYETALREWLPLAEGGSAPAQFNIGLLYEQGKGVAADQGVAVEWFDRSAELGFARAQYRLADIYERGDGVEQDYVTALKWFQLAGRQRYEDARKRRQRLAKKMTSTQIAYAEMYVRQWKQQRRQERATSKR